MAGDFDPKRQVMASDLDIIEKQMKILHGRVDNCMEKVDIGNDIARDTQVKLSETNKSVERILELLTGNELDDSDNGILGDIRNLKVRTTNLEKKLDKAFYIIIGFSLATGWALSDIITKLFHK